MSFPSKSSNNVKVLKELTKKEIIKIFQNGLIRISKNPISNIITKSKNSAGSILTSIITLKENSSKVLFNIKVYTNGRLEIEDEYEMIPLITEFRNDTFIEIEYNDNEISETLYPVYTTELQEVNFGKKKKKKKKKSARRQRRPSLILSSDIKFL